MPIPPDSPHDESSLAITMELGTLANMSANKEISVRFENSPNRRVFTPTGVWGGLNAQAKVVANFYTESRAYPDSVTISIEPDGKSTETPEATAVTFIREIHSTIIFDAKTAESVGKWLLEKAAKAREAFSKRQPSARP